MTEDVLVSICCITYNHAPYIRECLDAFLMQKANFKYEILIHDDASTDETAEIIREYEAKYPKIIKPIYQIENQYSKGVSLEATFNWPRAKGKYIALCEGDDYWIDPLKLQKQVDFLEKNQDCSLCFHASKSIKNNNPRDFFIRRPNNIPKDYRFQIETGCIGDRYMATNSMFFLKDYINDLPDWMNNTPVGDFPLLLLLATKGKIGYIDEVMSVYRIASSSASWSVRMQNPELRKKHHYGMLNMWTNFDKWSDYKYHTFVTKMRRDRFKEYYKGQLSFSLKKLYNKLIVREFCNRTLKAI